MEIVLCKERDSSDTDMTDFTEVDFQIVEHGKRGAWASYVYDSLWWAIPDYTKTSHLFQELQGLQKALKDLSVFVPSLYANTPMSMLSEFVSSSECKYVAVPVILTSTYINHMIMILVDKKRKRIVYYDPQAKDPLVEFRKAEYFWIEPGVQCSTPVICRVLQDCTMCDLFYSKEADQTWCSPMSCGLYCVRFLENYILFRETIQRSFGLVSLL